MFKNTNKATNIYKSFTICLQTPRFFHFLSVVTFYDFVLRLFVFQASDLLSVRLLLLVWTRVIVPAPNNIFFTGYDYYYVDIYTHKNMIWISIMISMVTLNHFEPGHKIDLIRKIMMLVVTKNKCTKFKFKLFWKER